MRAEALAFTILASTSACDRPDPCLEAAIRHVRAPSETRDASIYEGGCGPSLAPQVVVEFETPQGKGGGGVFAVRDSITRLNVRWVSDDTLEIEYPASAQIEKRDTLMRFYNERVRVVYKVAKPAHVLRDSVQGAT